jgi:hypothetical protein
VGGCGCRGGRHRQRGVVGGRAGTRAISRATSLMGEATPCTPTVFGTRVALSFCTHACVLVLIACFARVSVRRAVEGRDARGARHLLLRERRAVQRAVPPGQDGWQRCAPVARARARARGGNAALSERRRACFFASQGRSLSPPPSLRATRSSSRSASLTWSAFIWSRASTSRACDRGVDKWRLSLWRCSSLYTACVYTPIVSNKIVVLFVGAAAALPAWDKHCTGRMFGTFLYCSRRACPHLVRCLLF